MTTSKLFRICVLVGAGILAAMAGPALAQPNDKARAMRGEETAVSSPGSSIASHRGYRATRLFGATVHNRRGEAIGSVEDVVIDTCSGEVRHAVLTLGEGLLPGGGRQVAAPIGSLRGQVVGAIESPVDRLLLDIDPANIADLPAAGDSAAPAADAPCERELRASWLIGRELFGRNGQGIGKVADLVINMNRARVNFAVLAFDPSPGPPDRLLAFPVQLFDIEAGDRVVFPMSARTLSKLPGFVESGWSHVLSPDELADVDRQFIADFPAVWNESPRTLFEHLDRDQSGRLSRVEVVSNVQVLRHFAVIDSDGDRRLSKPEFVLNFPGVVGE